MTGLSSPADFVPTQEDDAKFLDRLRDVAKLIAKTANFNQRIDQLAEATAKFLAAKAEADATLAELAEVKATHAAKLAEADERHVFATTERERNMQSRIDSQQNTINGRNHASLERERATQAALDAAQATNAKADARLAKMLAA